MMILILAAAPSALFLLCYALPRLLTTFSFEAPRTVPKPTARMLGRSNGLAPRPGAATNPPAGGVAASPVLLGPGGDFIRSWPEGSAHQGSAGVSPADALSSPSSLRASVASSLPDSIPQSLNPSIPR